MAIGINGTGTGINRESRVSTINDNMPILVIPVIAGKVKQLVQ